ncbi:MAG TPA: hypothetical protein VFS56_11205, partial [Gemmatimonadaceae bacterium]|nr:hypothetical protein [Gemmatimonadaceae bacterium]
NAANVATAIDTVLPFGVDVCSGVRTKGALDEEKLRGFMNAVSPSPLPRSHWPTTRSLSP